MAASRRRWRESVAIRRNVPYGTWNTWYRSTEQLEGAAMRRQIIAHTAVTQAPPDVVFDRLLDATTWPEWSGHFSGKVLTAVDTPGGVGEVREFRIGRKVSVERVVESVRPR